MNLLELEAQLQTLFETLPTRIAPCHKPRELTAQSQTGAMPLGSARKAQRSLGAAPGMFTRFLSPQSLAGLNGSGLQHTIPEVLRSALKDEPRTRLQHQRLSLPTVLTAGDAIKCGQAPVAVSSASRAAPSGISGLSRKTHG